MLAHLAEDPGLIDAFERGADVHTTTAAAGLRRRPRRRSTTRQRRFAKVVNYGLAYGMEAYGLGQRLDIPTDEAREILDAYFDGVPERAARTWTATVQEAKERGYTTTLFGRRRQIPELVVRQLPHPPDGGAHGAERAGAGHRRPTSSSSR